MLHYTEHTYMLSNTVNLNTDRFLKTSAQIELTGFVQYIKALLLFC